MLRLPLLVLAGVLFAQPVAAQPLQLAPDLSLAISGTIQPRLSYGVQDVVVDGVTSRTERLGYGLRRARLQTRFTYDDRLGFEFDFDGRSGTLESVDLYGFYTLGDNIEVRAGRQPGAQPRSYVPTSHSRIDLIERAAIAERWSQGTIGSSGRDIGVDLEVTTDATKAVVFVHGGTGSFGRSEGNLRESITSGDVTRGSDQTSVAVTAMVQHEIAALPGVEIGAFGGYNPAGGEATEFEGVGRAYTTGGAHAYWGAVPGSQPVRLKLDALGIRYEDVDGFQQEAVGLSALGAVGLLGRSEALVRVERYWEDLDADAETFVTVGASYSASAARGDAFHRARYTLAYAFRDTPLGEDAHLAVVQAQFAF